MVTKTRPVIERIVQLVKQRCDVLMTDVYPNSPVVEVLRPSRTISFTPRSWQLIITLGDQDRNDDLSKPGNPPSVAFDAVINIHCHLMPSETDDTPIEEYQNVFYADTIEAITDSGDAGWWSWGGLAINTQIAPMEPIAADGGVDGFKIPLEVCYRVSEWSPYEVRY